MNTPRPVILDTDWYTDVDDVMATRVLINMQRRGIFRILGLGINARFPMSAQSLDAFLLAHGVDVPVGAVPTWEGDNSAPNGPSYQKFLAAMPSKYATDAEIQPAHLLYRKLLASSPEKVDMIGIGFEGNFAALLETAPDEFSPLTGRELVARKVARLWLMAGRWPQGQEYNLAGAGGVNKVITRAGATVLSQWPTPITFLGFEIGYPVFSGAKLPDDDLLRRAMDYYDATPGYGLAGHAPDFHLEAPMQRAHFSWDPLTVILAGLQDPALSGFDIRRGTASSNPEDGTNNFQEDPAGPHAYVVKTHPDDYYGNLVDQWLPFA